MKRFSLLVISALLITLWPARAAEDADEHYLRIMQVIEQADSFDTPSQAGQALAKYQQAQTALRDFQKIHPTWNVKIVSYRSKYLAERVAALTAKPSAPDESDEATVKRDARPETKGASATSTAQVKLLEAGAEPRKVLRLHPKPGDKQTIGMTMKISMNMKIGELDTPAMKLPAMTTTTEITVKTVSPEGDIAYEMVISDANVADDPDALPQVAEAIKSSFAAIKGLTGTGAMSNRGLSKGMDIKVPADVNPQMRQTMEQMKESFSHAALGLPEEAVGPGAKWEVKMPIKSEGMTISQTTTYQLVSVEGERVTAKSIVAQSAANQKMQNPAMPALKLDLKKMTGAGTGEVTADLAQLLPAQGSVDSHSEFSMEMNTGGQKQTMSMTMDLNMRLEVK